MKITIIHGQSHKGSSYHITEQIIDKISDDNIEICEYFMPNDAPKFCIGCYKCFFEGEDKCPQAEKVQKIVKSMEMSDVIIVDSPAYCFDMTGQLKTLFDHLAYMWLPHRPRKSMFDKIGIVVSTAAGGGAASTTKMISKQFFYFGIPRIYRYSKCVNAPNWESVPEKIKNEISHDTTRIALKVKSKIGKVKPGLKLKFMFMVMRMMQKSNTWNMNDKSYWENNGWLDKKRPWTEK